MPINQNEIVDLLYKKIAFNSAKTDTQASRSASEEPIVSPVSAYGNHVWVSAGLIPGTPPGADSLIVKRQQSSDTEHIQLSVNPDVATHRSWLALTTGNASQMLNWIPPIFGSQYGLKVWVGDPTQAGSYRIYSKGTGADDQFYFDYNAGSLHFIGQNLPAGINAGSQIYIEGYRYVGSTDLSNLQATALNDLSDVTVDSIGLTDGQVLQWSQTQNQWISGPVSGGAMQDFLITPPKQTGQTLVYEAVNASGVGVNKFKNEFLNYAYLDGLPGATNAHAGSFLKATASGTATNPSVMELEWQPLTDLYTPLGVIDIVSSNIFHLDASRATDLDPTSPATGQDVIVTTDPSRTELPDNSSYDPNRHGAKYLADPNLWVMKTTELDKHGHVLGRVWTNLTDTLDGYVEQGDYDTKWASHESGGMPRHNIWTHLDGVHAQTQSALAREKLLIKNEDDLLYPLDHPGIIISSNAITEIHGTHVAGKAIPDSSSAPSDLDILAFSQAQNAWVLSSIASGAGEANEGISLSATDTDSFNIYKDKDLEFLRFRGIKVFDGNDIAVTDWDHTWDNGVIPDADFPFLVRENPSNGNTIEFKFDASKIKIYELGDRLAPSNVGYTIQQLEDWSSAEPLINPPNSGTGANTVQGRAYAEGWFSNPVDSSTPNEMTQLEWAALMGGGIATDDSNGRRLRTSQRVWHSPTNTYLPTSIQQQIDDKLQFKFFKDHFTLGNRAPEVRNLNFGGYYSTMSNYGSPGIVETTEGLENPIYEGVGWAHESKSILFDATEIKHAGEASGWGFTYNNNWGTATSPEWANHGIHKWNYGGGDETYNTVKSVITRHILTHEGNPHAVTHLEVGSETAQWNANKIQDANVTVSDLENNDVLVWDGSGWINSDILTQGGEQNQAVNIGSGEGLYTNRSGHYLQFKGLSSSNTKLVLNATADNIEFEIDETQIDITNLMNFPIDINQLGDVSGAPSDGDVLTYNGSEWVPAEPGTADFVYDGTGVDEDFLLRAQEVMDPFTGLSQSPKKWKWMPSDKYTTANKLAGLAHSVSGIIQTGDLSIDYEDIADGHIMKWNGVSWVAAVNPAVTGAGEINRIGSWADTDLGALQSSSGTTLACTTVTLGDGTVLDVSKQSVDVDSVSTMRLMVKTVVPTAYISIDTAVSNAKEIGFTLDETQIQLDNLSGDLDPMRISPNTVNTQAFGALVGYNGMNIKSRFENVETDISNLETNKLDVTTFNLHTAYDTSIRPTDYKVGYGPIVNPGNTFGQTYIPNDAGLKHQPYEIGHNKPVFNASRIMNAPVDEAFIISDGNIGASTLDMADAGKYMQWDGYKWTIGGGGEISTGEHMQFAYYHAHTPAVNATTQILKPVGNVLNFVEGTGLIESKLGMHTTTPHASFSIAGSSPSLGLKQIGNAINEPDLEAGWGTLYARSSAGGITAESIIIMHFDGADGGNAFLNYGNADLFFLPQHDPDGNGIYDSVNNVRTKAERNIYGGTSGFFPGGVGDYLAAPAVDQINLAKKPFSIDFWMCPTVDTPGEQLSGKQYLCGQFDAIHSYWYLAINYEKDDTPTADVHSIELTWKEYDAATTTAYLHTRSLTRFSSDSFTPDTWYHIVFQRIPFGSSTDTWQLLIAEAPAGHQTGVPTSASMGLPHTISEIGPVVQLDIDDYDSDFLIGNFCRQEAISTGNDFDSFKGYLDEFRFQIGTYINWEGLSVGGYYLSYLLPYDTGNSALIFKDDLGTYDLLNSAGIVRRLTDQDGDTRLDLDTKDSNDNTIRFITSAVEIASFSQLGMCLSNDDVRVSSIKDDLNNSFSSALVTQRAVKEALDSISTKSIEDTAGTTYVQTEQTVNDQAIRMAVDGNEKLVIDSTGFHLKSPFSLDGNFGGNGQVLLSDGSGNLSWGDMDTDNIAAGTEGNVAYYPSAGQALSGSPNFSWDNSSNVLKIKGKQQFHYFDLDTTTILNDTAELRVQLDADGNDANTTVLFHFDTYTMETTSSVDYVGTSAAIVGAQTSHGEDTTIKKFGASSWRSGIYDSNGDLSGPQGNSNSGQAVIGPINLFAISGNTWTHDFWIRPSTSSVTGNTSISNDTVIYEAFKEFGGSWGVYTNQYNDGNASLDEIDLKVDLNNGAMVTIGKLKVKTWQHVALMRNGNTFTAFINGYPIYSDTNAQFEDYGFGQGTVIWPSGWTEVDGAGNANRLSDFFGHIDEFRISTTNRYPETGFAPRGTPYGTNETKFLLESKDNVTVDILEPNSDAVTTEDLLRGNYLVRGQGENPKAVADSNIYALGNSLSIATTRTPSNLNVGGTIGLSNKSESDSDFTESFTSLHAVGVDNVTKALIHCDGNATNYSNTSSDQFVVWHPSSESKFGTGSGNSITLHPSLGYPGNMAFGTQDGTLEFWVRSVDSTVGWAGGWNGREGGFIVFAGDYHGYLTLLLAESNDYMVLSNQAWSYGVNGQYNPSDWTPDISNGETKWAIDGKWHHFCWMREGTFSGFFIDGVLKASKTMSAGQDINSYFWNKWNEGNDPWGGRVGWKQQSNGTLVDELRISVGAARYNITGFTPPSTRVEETLKYTSDEGWDVLLTDLPRRFQNGQLSVPGVKADNLEMEFYTDEADYPSAICNIESAKVFLANENPTPIDEYTTVLFHWDDPQMIANPGGGGTDIAAHWTNSGATGYQYTLTHVNNYNDSNNGKHGGYSTTSRFGTNGFLVGWMDDITVDASSELVDALDFGSDDFTIDFWVRHSPWSGSANTPMGNSNTHYNPSRWFRTDAWTLDTYRTTGPNGLTNTIVFTFTDLPGDSFCFNAPSGVTDYNTNFVWNHWAFVRHGDDFDFYVNGIQFSKGAGGTATSVAGLDMTPISPTGLGIGIGGMWSSAQMMQNVFDEFRISKGIARWTDEFVCQLPYAAYGSMIEVPDVKLAGQYATVSLATDRHLASLATKEQVSLGGSMPVGSVIAFGGSTAPAGWLMTDGSTISRTTYSSLFAVIEDDFGGGDGSTTFELPNYNNSGSGPQKYIIKI